MKKLLSVFLVLAMCLSFASCGKSGEEVSQPAAEPVQTEAPEAPAAAEPEAPEVPETPAETEPEAPEEPEEPAAESEDTVSLPEDGNLCYVIEGGNINYNFYEYYNEDAMVFAAVNAVDAVTGETLWNFVTEPQYVGQLDNYTVVGLNTAGFVFTKEDVVYCLNPVSGELEWTSEPMTGWPTGYFAVDNSCNFYFPGYFTASLTVIDCGGNTVHRYDELQSIYGSPIEDGWCEGISVDENGYVHIKYNYEYPSTYVIDPQTGCAVDEYVSSIPVSAEMLAGSWMDNIYGGEQHVILTVNDDLSFNMANYNPDGSYMYTYEGYFEIDTFSEDVGSDWLISHLTYTDDPNFADWGGIGDYVATYFYEDEEHGEKTIELVQVNNGDSVLSWYYDMFSIVLHKVEPMG